MPQATTSASAAFRTARRLPATIYKIAFSLIAFLIVPWWIFLGGPENAQGPGMFGVALVFSIIALGFATVAVVLALSGRRRNGLGAARSKTDPSAPVQVSEGTLSRREATTQVLIVPTAVAAAFILLAVVDAIERV